MTVGNSSADMLLTLLKLSGAVFGILGLAYLVLNKGVGKLMGRPTHQGNLKVLDKCMLDQRNSLYIIEVGGKQLLIASGQSGSNLISNLEEPVTPLAKKVDQVSPMPMFSSWLCQKKNSKILPS